MNHIVTMKGAAYRGPDSPERNERIILRLSEDWALGYDRLQWMVCRKRMRKGKITWSPQSFIASRLAVLMRTIAEKGITLTPEANVALHAFPDTFREWLAEQDRQNVA